MLSSTHQALVAVGSRISLQVDCLTQSGSSHSVMIALQPGYHSSSMNKPLDLADPYLQVAHLQGWFLPISSWWYHPLWESACAFSSRALASVWVPCKPDSIFEFPTLDAPHRPEIIAYKGISSLHTASVRDVLSSFAHLLKTLLPLGRLA